jgi:hypothetical protein
LYLKTGEKMMKKDKNQADKPVLSDQNQNDQMLTPDMIAALYARSLRERERLGAFENPRWYASHNSSLYS